MPARRLMEKSAPDWCRDLEDSSSPLEKFMSFVENEVWAGFSTGTGAKQNEITERQGVGCALRYLTYCIIYT